MNLEISNLIKYIEEEHGDVDLVSSTGMSLLHYAVFYERIENIQYLVAMGAKINCQDLSGNPPLYLAILKGNLGIVKYLLECGANPNIQNKQGKMSLHYAVSSKNARSLVELLLSTINMQTNVNLTDIDGNTPVFYVKDPQILDIFIQKKANLNIRNEKGLTPLIVNVHRYITTHEPPYREIIKKLLDQSQLDLNIRDRSGKTVLHHIVVGDQKELLEMVLKQSNPEPSTQSIYLINKNPFKSSEVSTKHWINLKIRDFNKETCIDMAKRLQYDDLVYVLTSYNSSTDQ